MIPVRLSLRNFLSYGEEVEPLDFSAIHLACLSGSNGHGKSALLDAITWALWGIARAPSADDLVRLHQTSMHVEFEFELEGQLYRVVRKRSRGKQGQSDLQLQVRGDGDWRSLSEGGVRGTQERITRLLHMDYDTFVNSAFILQGRADEFARRSPGERKRILGEILNLGDYDALAEAARRRARDARARREALEAEIARLDAEVRREPERRADAQRLEKEEAASRLRCEQLRADLNAVLVEKTALDARRRERDDLARRLESARSEILRLQHQQLAAERRRGEAQALLLRSEEVRCRHAELLRGQARLRALNEAMLAGRCLETQRAALDAELRARESELGMQLRIAREFVAQLQGWERDQPSRQQRVTALGEQVAGLDRLEAEREGLQSDLERLAGERAAAAAEQSSVAVLAEKAGERFALLKQADAVCPVCEETLSPEKRKALGWKVREEKQSLEREGEAAARREREAGAAIAAARKRAGEIERHLRSGEVWRRQLVEEEQELAKCAAATTQLPEARAAVRGHEETLAAGAFAPETRAALAALERQLASLGYDEAEHHALQECLARMQGVERDLAALEQAEKDLPAAQEELRLVAAAVAEKEARLHEDHAALAAADQALERVTTVEQEAARLAAELAEADTRHSALARELGSAQAALEQCRAQLVLLREKRSARDQAARDAENYEQLDRLFGRNGIQAVIIENAIPEIEQEANAILARMSDSEMRVAFHTQRDKKDGGVTETLEIQISDSLGSRRYELFSGGEAFRINFAIRIALSKLLARRAGARLQTLIIDEGFGSQDAEGRERLVDAIHSIQEEFARIIVITHVDEMKEYFPTRIEVTKNHLGSQVTVV
jgi:exonuclease SbcC